MRPAIIAATGLYTPPESISNAELVEAFNAYAERFNAENAAAIAEGRVEAIPPSSAEFIEKASGIKSRFVVQKSGILDPAVMRPVIPERRTRKFRSSAEMAVKAAQRRAGALGQAARPDRRGDRRVLEHAARVPGDSVEVQEALGAKGFAFDMNVACSSATFGINVAHDQVTAGPLDARARGQRPRSAPAISTSATARATSSSATCAPPSSSRRGDEARGGWDILGTRLKTRFSNNIRNNTGFLNRAWPEGRDLPDKLFVQQGRKVFKEVVPLVSEMILEHAADLGLDTHRLKRLWLHQANINMNELIGRRVLGRDPTREENVIILDEYANTSSCRLHHRLPQALGRYGA